ncbi:MAG: formylglycine-generating enzyme family protein [Syntrophales bacterium]
MKKLRILLTAWFFLTTFNLYAAEVKNVICKQVGNQVQLTYDLIGDEADAEVDVMLTIQGKSYKTSDLHLKGDFGKVLTGKGKILWWNVLQDFPRGVYAANMAWRIVAWERVFTSPTLGAKFVLIPAGTFLMGKSGNQHQVTISQAFYMQTTELTQGQWKRLMGSNPSHFSSCGDDCPVEMVSWHDVQDFIRKLNRQEGTDKYRLPTEAEWEYAARSGGRQEEYAGTSSESNFGDYAWYFANSDSKTHSVGQKRPNALELYDMSGNVWEWVQDGYGNYPSNHVTDPAGPSSGSRAVNRGGSWGNFAQLCRTAFRSSYTLSSRSAYLGFRLARTP